jgi:hypothetical protein
MKQSDLQSDLSVQLREDTALNVPPFGADSIRIARDSGSKATSFLLQEVKDGGSTAFLALEALREADPVAYSALPARKRAEVYVNALKSSIFYNAWGLPGYQLTPTAHAVISLGDDAVRALKPLLGDLRPAPLSGSQDATTSSMYGNRVCDYAWVFINEIEDQPYVYSQDPAERDRAIAVLLQKLQGDIRRDEAE